MQKRPGQLPMETSTDLEEEIKKECLGNKYVCNLEVKSSKTDKKAREPLQKTQKHFPREVGHKLPGGFLEVFCFCFCFLGFFFF